MKNKLALLPLILFTGFSIVNCGGGSGGSTPAPDPAPSDPVTNAKPVITIDAGNTIYQSGSSSPTVVITDPDGDTLTNTFLCDGKSQDPFNYSTIRAGFYSVDSCKITASDSEFSVETLFTPLVLRGASSDTYRTDNLYASINDIPGNLLNSLPKTTLLTELNNYDAVGLSSLRAGIENLINNFTNNLTDSYYVIDELKIIVGESVIDIGNQTSSIVGMNPGDIVYHSLPVSTAEMCQAALLFDPAFGNTPWYGANCI